MLIFACLDVTKKKGTLFVTCQLVGQLLFLLVERFTESTKKHTRRAGNRGRKGSKERADQQEREYSHSSILLGSKLEEIMLHEMTSSRKGRCCMKSEVRDVLA